MSTETIILPRALATAPWAAYDALQPALLQALEQNRADWVRRMARGNDLAESWALFHHEARRPDSTFTTGATAVLVRHGAQTLAFLTKGPHGLADQLAAQGLGTVVRKPASEPDLGDGLIIAARIQRNDVDPKSTDLHGAIAGRLAQYPGHTSQHPAPGSSPRRTPLRLVHSVREPVRV